MEADRLGHREGLAAVVVVVDTSFLISLSEGLAAPSMILDALEASFRLVAPRQVVVELERLSTQAKPKVRRAARKALWLLGRLGVEVVDVEAGQADDAVESLARRLKGEGFRVVVATNDRELRRRVRSLGIPSLYYRESTGGLEVEWGIL
ncbi:PIN domain-containing protein [Stetteria hydrogenophila]